MKMPGPSPMRLACWAAAGSSGMAISFLLLILPITLLRIDHCIGLFSSKNLLRLTIVLTPLVSGLAVSLMAERRLRRGIDNEEWQERELVPLRKVLDHPAWTVIGVIPLVALIGYGMTSKVFHGSALFWGLMAPVQTISRLRMMVKPKGVAGVGVLQDWRSFKPIQSEHWGKSRQDSFSS